MGTVSSVVVADELALSKFVCVVAVCGVNAIAIVVVVVSHFD